MSVSTAVSVDRDVSNKEKSRLNSQPGTRRSSVTFSIDSNSSSASNSIMSFKESQSGGTERSTSQEGKTDSRPSKRLGGSLDSKFPMESAAFCPLLPREKYHERVLTSDALQRRRIKPGLVSDREKASYRSRIGVVDGVRDLQQAVTGLLCRHNREALEYVPEYDKRNTKDSANNPSQDFFLTDISYDDHLKAQSRPVDDRITPQTLHTLLRNSRTAVAKILPPSLEPREVVQYTASMKLAENNSVLRSELNPAKESIVPSTRQGKKNIPGRSIQDTGKKECGSLQANEKKKRESCIHRISLPGHQRSNAQDGTGREEANSGAITAADPLFSSSPHSPPSQLPRHPPSRAKLNAASRSYQKRRTAQGETPDEFIRRTACPRSSARPTSAKALAERVSPALQLSSTSPSNSSPGTTSTTRFALEQQHISHGLKEMLLADVRYSEAPNLALAHKASYYSTTRDDAAPPGGIGIGFPSVPLQEKHPVEGCLTYPPAPITYESKEIEKKTLSLQRLAPRSGKKSTPSVKSPTIKNAFLELLDQHEVKDREEGSFGYRVKEGSVLDYTFRIGSPGEDSSVVSQLVKEVIETRLQEQEQERKERKFRGVPIGEGQSRASPWNSAPSSQLPLQTFHGPGFSLVESVLKVSRELELFQNGKKTLDSKGSSSFSAQRQEAAEQLVAFRSSRIPEEFWLSITDKNISACTRLLQKKNHSKRSRRFYQGKWVSIEETTHAESDSARNEKQEMESVKGESLDNCSHIGNRSRSKDAGSEGAIIFPGAKPVERSQVYLLADVLDLMVRQVKDYYVLFDASTAKRILPSSAVNSADCGSEGSNRELPLPSYVGREVGGETIKAKTLYSFSSDVDNPLLLPEVQERSSQVHLAYTTVADQVVNIFDIGMSEVVRQVGSHCIERGALLDALRQSLVDLTKSSINLLYHAKEVAFKEASKRRDIQEELQRVQRQMLEQALRIQELEMDNSALYEWNNTLQLKASRMDTLLERMEEKKKRYDFHSEDEHAFLLMELEKDMISTASKTVEVVDTQKARFSAFSSQSPGQAPTAAEARKRVLDANSAMQTLYSESASLLTELRNCSATTNSACAAFYDNVSLGTLSPSANLPAAKWASVARAVGDFEKEKVHRYRVFNVFSKWCSRFKKTQEEAQDTREGGNFLLDSSPDNSLENSLHNDSNATSISVDSVDKGTLVRKRPPGERSQSEKRFRDSEKTLPTFSHSVEEELKSIKSQDSSAEDPFVSTPPKLITFQELQEMQVHDCTPAEVNALFERKFDFKTFLHAPWEPSDSHYKLNISDVADMVHDVRVFIQELTVRMQALSESAIMKKGIEPPLSPPANPEVPCPLCARREVSGERRKHQEALQFIAREVQQQMEELTRKFQKAESEREDARGEARRLHQELDAALEREAALRAEVNELLQARFTVKTSDGKGQRDTTVNGASDLSKNFSSSTASYATLQDTGDFSDEFSPSSLLHTVGKNGKTMSKGLLSEINPRGREKRRGSPVFGKRKRLSFTEEMLSHMSEVLSARQSRSSIQGGSILQANNTMLNESLVAIPEESKAGCSQDSLLVHKVASTEMEEGYLKKSLSSSGHSGVALNIEGPDLEKSKSTSY